MSYTYASFQTALALEMVVPNANVNEPNFVAILPTIVDYAEQRCYRELDLLTAETRQWFLMTPFQRAQGFPVAGAVYAIPPAAQQIIVAHRVRLLPPTYVIPPPPNQPADSGGEPLVPTTVDYMDAVYSDSYPGAGVYGRPTRFALLDDQTIVFGPTPDQAYYFLIHGAARPVPLYSAAPGDGSQTTFLTSVLPDLFLAAAMVSAAGYRKNYGAQADDPRMAVSWETQYQELLSSAKAEEVQKKFLGWNMMSSYPSPPMPAPSPAPAPG